MNLIKLVELSRALKPVSFNMRTFHTSFILNKNRVVAIGINQRKTNPANLFNPKYNREGKNISSEKFTCSEYGAFQKLKRTNIDAKKCILVNIRIDRNDRLANSCPCQSCQSLLSWLRFKKVIYSTDNGEFANYENLY